MKKKDKSINPVLEESIDKLLKQVMDDPASSLIDKCRVLDRAINVEKLKAKLNDDEWGSGFIAPDDEEE